jgi:hypothetical protein
MKRLLFIALSSAALAIPAAAQDEAGDKVNTVLVFGQDPCVESAPGELTICVRMDEQERYRIPEALRQSRDPANESWASRVQGFEAVGDFGPLSCSTVGAGAELGCTAQFIEAAYAERRSGPGVRRTVVRSDPSSSGSRTPARIPWNPRPEPPGHRAGVSVPGAGRRTGGRGAGAARRCETHPRRLATGGGVVRSGAVHRCRRGAASCCGIQTAGVAACRHGIP